MTDAYERLLFAYPRDYRRERGRELVDMHRELAGDRRFPRASDAADLVLGGLRERLRAAGLAGLTDVLPVAAVAALSAMSALSLYYLVVFEFHPATALGHELYGRGVGPFATFYAFSYLGWLVTAVLAAVRPGRAARVAAAASVLLLLLGLALRMTPIPVPSLSVIIPLPLVVVGTLAVFLPSPASRTARLAPVTAVVVTALAAAVRLPLGQPELFFGGTSIWTMDADTYGICCDYRLPASYVQHLAALGLLAAGVIIAGLWARRGRTAGLWLLLVLATPIVSLEAMWLAEHDPVRAGLDQVTGLVELRFALMVAGGVLVTAVVLPALFMSARLLRRAVSVR